MQRRGLDTDRMPAASDLEQARYARMRWTAPLSGEHAKLLLERLEIRQGASLLDLGCGWGELLLRAVGSAGVTTGIGVDTPGGRPLFGDGCTSARIAACSASATSALAESRQTRNQPGGTGT